MQVNKKDGNRYVKELDKVDLYLVNMMRRFFTADTSGLKECAESIIAEAVKRAKDDIFIDGTYGVFELIMADGTKRNGSVTITPEDIGAEPAIEPKHNAFNKPFGTEADTVCEGNDPRLSDAREPLPHEHPEYLKAGDVHFDLATETDDGLMSAGDKTKLDGLSNYTHPTTSGNIHIPSGGTTDQYLAWASDGVAKWADNPMISSLVTETKDGIMSHLDKIKLDNIDDEANKYVHPNTSGYKHIPAGGATGQILEWLSVGEAKWVDQTIIPVVTETVDGIMSKDDKKKLDGIEDGANKYVHPTTSGNKHIPTGGVAGQELTWKADGEAQWTNQEAKPIGNDGQVYYIDGNSSSTVKLDYILEKAQVVDTDAELITAKNTAVDFAEVFNTWYRFSHAGTTQPAPVDSTNLALTLADAWILSSNQVVCVPNSTSYIGFVSKNKYKNYTHEVVLKSDNNDNDRIGVVIAFAKDDSGVEHTLSALRNMDSPTTWFLVYDYNMSTQATLASKTVAGGAALTTWNLIPNGSRIKVKRSGDLIEAWASPFNLSASSDIVEASKLAVDLSTDPRLSVFRGECSYGYACLSQAHSTFTDINFVGGTDDAIYDALNNETWIVSGGIWSKSSTRSIYTDIGPGRFVRNDATNKSYYVGDGDTTLISEIGGMTDADRVKLDGIESGANKYVHPTTPGNIHVPAGGTAGQILEWQADGVATWKDLSTDKTTFEVNRIKKRGVCTLTLDPGTSTFSSVIDLTQINFYNAATYMAYYINADGAKEQIPAMLFNGFAISDIIKVDITEARLKVSVSRQDTTASKTYKVYYEVFDVDSSLTISRADGIKVLNLYPGTAGGTYNFTNWKGEVFTGIPMTAQCKRWMEEANDESPKGYGQGLVSVDVLDVAVFNASANPAADYLKNPDGTWKYDTVYFGTWDSNNGKGYSTAGISAISELIAAGRGYISGHDTPWQPFATAMNMSTYSTPFSTCAEIKVKKAGMVSSFPWNLGDIDTSLFVPPSHVSSQFHSGDIWFKYNYPPSFTEVSVNGGVAGTNNFYLGTYKNTAFIQAGHTSGAASADEQKILANVFYYLANKGG